MSIWIGTGISDYLVLCGTARLGGVSPGESGRAPRPFPTPRGRLTAFALMSSSVLSDRL